MSLTQIHSSNEQRPSGLALLNLGFRPFFLCAGIYACLSVAIWFFIYARGLRLPLGDLPVFFWHAHEMVYGYSLAVIAGFLLTATKTWTGLQTPHGITLGAILLLWLLARIAMFTGVFSLAALFDITFMLSLTIAISIPIIRVRQWRQGPVISKLVILLMANSLFYAGVLGWIENGIYPGIYIGLYLVIGLIMMMGRRVIPFFIERGVGYEVKLYNSKWADLSSLFLFVIFFVGEMVESGTAVSAYSALLLFVINAVRLVYWHTPGIWKKPLLWSLYFAMWFISLGFLCHFLAYFNLVTSFVALHAFSYGGIGLMTLAMMARVSLGHSGRNIHDVPAGIAFAFICLILGAVVRVLFSTLWAHQYLLWVSISQGLWVLAFAIFIYRYWSILTRPRIDGRFG